MGIGNIISDIKGIIDTFTSDGAKGRYPTQIGSKTEVEKLTNSIKSSKGNWKSSRGYAFEVVKVGQGGQVSAADGWKEFLLQINPQDLQQDELFAVEVTPTFRGVIVEHQGTILKDIIISGTTGISPGRKEGGAFADTGKPVLSSGWSGYEEFNELRSYFRVYVEAKRLAPKNTEEPELRMIFKNYKDNEYLFVEPQKFSMKRSSAKPFMYDYSISLKGIGQAYSQPPKKGFSLDDLVQAVQDIQDTIDSAVKVMNGSLAIIKRFERDISDTIINPLISVQQFFAAVAVGRKDLTGGAITRRFMERLKNECARVEYNFNDALGRDMSKFNTAVNRTPTTVGTPGRITTYQELQMLNALRQAQRALDKAVTYSPNIMEPNIYDKNKTVTDSYKNKFELLAPASVKPVTILGTDTIQTIAARELGNPDRFRELIILNNLKPPYIDPSGAPGTLKPGDKILLPQLQPTLATGSAKNKIYEISRFLSESERNLGIDIKVDDNGDLVISNTGDLDMIAGVDNMVQVIGLRLLLENGSLQRHPEIGTGLGIGSKVTAQSLQLLRSQVSASLGADPRIESIPYISLTQEGNTILLNMLLRLKNLDEPIPMGLAVNT